MSADDVKNKRRRQARVEKYLINPLMRPIIRFFPRAYSLLETTGRRTGCTRRTPIGNGADGDTFWLVAEHGSNCDYVKNLIADPHVRVRVRHRWRTGTAELVGDTDPLGRRRALDRNNGLIGRFDGVIFRSNATEPSTIRIDLDPLPA